jgi:hypothetical protein
MASVHESHYRKAEELIAAFSDPEEKDILLATLRVVPKPVDGT